MNKQYTILCVDDEESILKCLTRVLEPEGYKILTAKNGEEGLAVLANNNIVDLIITDQRMPVMDGSWFLRAVKKRYPAMISIMLSGYSDFDALVTALNDGEVFRFLTKPWDNEDLKRIVKQALEQKQMTTLIKEVISEAQAAFKIMGKITMDVDENPNSINLKVGEEGIVFSDEVIFKFLEFVFNAMGVAKKEELRVVSGYITRRKGTIIMTIDMGKGMSLNIQVPNEKP